MAAFSLRLDLAIEVNCHFLENEYGDLSFLSVSELSKGRFTRYDFVARDKFTTGLRHVLGPFTRERHFHLQN